MTTTVMKVETETETCSVCGGGGDLFTPEEHDAGAPPMQVPLRAMLLHINNNKVNYKINAIQRKLILILL